jgi:hypothetical protein
MARLLRSGVGVPNAQHKPAARERATVLGTGGTLNAAAKSVTSDEQALRCFARRLPADHAADDRQPAMADMWPDIPFDPWKDSCATVHLWTQIVGKYRLAHAPWLNHSWHATFYVTARGVTTSLFHAGERGVQFDFDFTGHRLIANAADGAAGGFPLSPMTVAEFHARFLDLAGELGLPARFHGSPNEVADPIPFARDTEHRAYDPGAVHRFWQALVKVERVFQRFRTGFLGKCSPVHLFWGSFDLAVTRFSGRRAPPHTGGIPALPDAVTREAYSHEVSSAGFWPGGGPVDYPAFYSYAYPAPEGYSDQRVEPGAAFFETGLGEFLLPYDAVRTARDPEDTLLRFLITTYDAAARLAEWDRAAVECPFGEAGTPRTP